MLETHAEHIAWGNCTCFPYGWLQRSPGSRAQARNSGKALPVLLFDLLRRAVASCSPHPCAQHWRLWGIRTRAVPIFHLPLGFVLWDAKAPFRRCLKGSEMSLLGCVPNMNQFASFSFIIDQGCGPRRGSHPPPPLKPPRQKSVRVNIVRKATPQQRVQSSGLRTRSSCFHKLCFSCISRWDNPTERGPRVHDDEPHPITQTAWCQALSAANHNLEEPGFR